MDDVLDLAKRLGEGIAADPRTEELREATAGVAGDPASKKLEEEYARVTSEYHEREEHGLPIEPDLKRRILDLQNQIRRSAVLQRLLKAHADFAEMMDGVQRAIGGVVDGALGGRADAGGEEPPGGSEPPPPPPEGPKSSILWTP